MRTSTLASAVVVLTLTLTGCSGSSTGPTPTPEEPAPTTSSTEPAAEDSPSAPEPGTDASTSEPAAAPGACLEGTWVLTAEELADVFAHLTQDASLTGTGVVTVDGDTVVTFEGTTLRQEWPGQTWTITTDAGGTKVETFMSLSGSSVSTISVEGEQITITEVDASGMDSSVEMHVDGEEVKTLPGIDLDEMLERTGTTLPEGRMTYRCTDGTLLLTALDEDGSTELATYTLVRG